MPKKVIALLPERAVSARRRKRGDDLGAPPDAKEAILAAGNVLAGLFDMFEAMAGGDSLPRAAEKALTKTRKRAEAIAKAEADRDPELP